MKNRHLIWLSAFLLFCITVLVMGFNAATKSISAPRSQNPSTGGTKRWLSAVPDPFQFDDPSVPVGVFRVVSGAPVGSPWKVKETIVENHSDKEVESVTLRWSLGTMENPLVSLAQGEMPPVKLKAILKQLLPGQRMTIPASVPPISELINRVPNAESLSDHFIVIVGVSKVSFEDGSTWDEASGVAKKNSMP